MASDITFLGGGISSIIAALELQKQGYQVTIIEKEPVLGGLASSFRKKGKWIPKTYHHILPAEKLFLKIIKKEGFDKYLLWNDSAISFWFDKKPYSLVSPIDILLFKPLSFLSRLRLFKLGAVAFLRRNWNSLKGKDAESWIRGFIGDEATDKLFKKLARIKFGELSTVSAAWFGERLHEAAVNQEKYAYLTCGLQELIDHLGDQIRKRGGKIYLGAEVTGLEGKKVSFYHQGKDKEIISNRIISSLPPPLLADLSDLDADKKKLLKSAEYKPLVCLVVSSKNLISSYYWNILIKPRMKFGGFFNHTAIYPEGGTGGENLYYFFAYLNLDDDLWNKPKDEIRNVFLDDIKKLFPDFKASWTKTFKIRYSSPVYDIGYENLPIKIDEKLYLTGVYRMYPSTRTMNSAAKSGVKTARLVIEEDRKLGRTPEK